MAEEEIQKNERGETYLWLLPGVDAAELSSSIGTAPTLGAGLIAFLIVLLLAS